MLEMLKWPSLQKCKEDVRLIIVTVHAKTSLVRTKIEIHFLAQLIATHIS